MIFAIIFHHARQLFSMLTLRLFRHIFDIAHIDIYNCRPSLSAIHAHTRVNDIDAYAMPDATRCRCLMAMPCCQSAAHHADASMKMLAASQQCGKEA